MTDKIELIKSYNLGHYLKVLLEHNTANNLPYHNLYHTLCVAWNSYKISLSEGQTNEERRIQLIAALFHDFNHSGGKLKDSENVAIAIREFLNHSRESLDTSDKVVDIIAATQYPYIIQDEDLTLSQKIIRDADLLQPFEDNYLQQVVIGLSEEMSIPLQQSLVGNPKFWANTKFYTEYAQETQKRKLRSILQDVEYINSL